jgi:hypothetical protein
MLKDGRVVSRQWLAKSGRKFTDISIDPKQRIRERRGLLEYVPLFPGFYALWRDYELNGYLMHEYDDPKVQNPSFYGSLNKNLQVNMGAKYDTVIVLLVSDELVYNFADQGKVRFFSDIAIKPEVEELPIANRADLLNCLRQHINGSDISGEIDLFDDGKTSVACPSDIEALIVDSDEIGKQVKVVAGACGCLKLPLIFVSELPRNDPFEDLFDS